MPPLDNDIAIGYWNDMLNGSQAAFGQLIHLYYAEMFKYGCSINQDTEIVKDCIQTVFLNIWRTRANLHSIDHIKFYLLKSLRRELYKEVQRDKSAAENNDQFTLTADHSIPNREDILIAKEDEEALVKKVSEGMLSLSKRQQEIIYLRFYMNLKPEEIAEVTGLNRQSVYNLLSDALKRLKESL